MRILLIRDYDARADQCRYVYDALQGCEISLLKYKYRKETPPAVPFPVHYWMDFPTPRRMLETIRPDKVVFADVETFDEVALNVTARKAGIPTFVLAHGVRLAEEVLERYRVRGTAAVLRKDWTNQQVAQRLHTLKFYLSVLPRCTLRERLLLLEFIYQRSAYDMTVALHKNRFELRRADFYIEFSRENTTYFQERDGVPSSRFKIIGNPTFDTILADTTDRSSVPHGDFYLLIDSPLAENESFGVSAADKRRFIEKLSTFARRRNAKLYVKLHPISYGGLDGDSYLPKDDNIIYGREVSMGPLLREAKGCFGILSTLLTLAPCLNRCIVFQLPKSAFSRDLVARGVATGLDFFDFTPDDIDFEATKPDAATLEAFVEQYLFKADGRATQRLREILLSDDPRQHPRQSAGELA